MGDLDYCDLYKHVFQNFKQDDLSYIHEPLPINERSDSILYASNLLHLE